MELVVASVYSVKHSFSRNTGWISTIKISKDSFKCSKSDQQKELGICTLIQSPNKSIMPRGPGINGGIDMWKSFEN